MSRNDTAKLRDQYSDESDEFAIVASKSDMVERSATE